MEIIDGKVNITVREFIDNIRKNGLPKTTGVLFYVELGPETQSEWAEDEYNNPLNLELGDTITMVCAFGQGLVNSNAAFDPDSPEFGELEKRVYDETWRLNDKSTLTYPDKIPNLSFEEIANKLEVTFEDNLHDILVFPYFDYAPFLENNAQSDE